MSRFHTEAPASKGVNRGAMRLVRMQKREEAEARNAKTPAERRKAYRLGDPSTRLLVKIFADGAAA